MKKTELIKNAIHKAVIITDFEDIIYSGWLVENRDNKKEYMILPFNGIPEHINCFKVSHIKHISYIRNNYKLW